MTASIDVEEVKRWLGYAGQPLDPSLAERIGRSVRTCEGAATPRWVWRLIPADSPLCAGLLVGDDIARHLAGASALAVMVSTAGIACDREIRKLSVLSALDALIFDTAASVVAEAAMDACEAEVRSSLVGSGMALGARFSPGYGDMPLDVQGAFLSCADAPRRIGVTVSSSNMLVPAKSVTAVAGIYAADDAVALTRMPSSQATDALPDGPCAGCPYAGVCMRAPADRPCPRVSR